MILALLDLDPGWWEIGDLASEVYGNRSRTSIESTRRAVLNLVRQGRIETRKGHGEERKITRRRVSSAARIWEPCGRPVQSCWRCDVGVPYRRIQPWSRTVLADLYGEGSEEMALADRTGRFHIWSSPEVAERESTARVSPSVRLVRRLRTPEEAAEERVARERAEARYAAFVEEARGLLGR